MDQLALAYEGKPTLINDKLNTSKFIDDIFRLLRSLGFDFFEVLDSVTNFHNAIHPYVHSIL